MSRSVLTLHVPMATSRKSLAAAALLCSLVVGPLRDGTVVELRWGSQVDCRTITDGARRDGQQSNGVTHPERVAAYLAKYLTKTTEEFGLPSRVRSVTGREGLSRSLTPTLC